MNKAKKNLAFQVMYQFITVLTPLITSPYLSRVLGPAQLGVFSSTYSYVCYFMLVCKLGVETYGCREIAKVSGDKQRTSEVFFGIYRVQLFFSFLSVAVYYLFLSIAGERLDNGYIMALQGLWIVSALTDINWMLFGLEEFVISTVRNTAIKIVTIILVFCLVKTPQDLDRYILIMAGGQILSMVVIWPYAAKRISYIRVSIRNSLTHLKPLLYFFVPVMAMSVFHIMDKTMLGLMSSEVESGYDYNVDRLGNIAIGVSLGINTVMLPRITNSIAGGNTNVSGTLEKSYELVIASAIAISVGLAAIGPLFVPVFFGDSFMPCVDLISVFAVALIAKSISGCICNQCLIPMDEEKHYVRAVLAGAGINLVCNYFLIRRYAAMGATIGTVIAEIAVLIIVLIKAREKSNMRRMGLDFLRYAVIGCVMFTAVRLVSSRMAHTWGNLLLVIALGGAVFAAGVLAVALLDRNSVFAELIRKKKRT